MKVALVTLVVGDQYINRFNNLSKSSWEKYCLKFNYDLIVITEPLDNSDRAKSRSVSWQKLLVLSQDWSNSYDRIIWVDSDIIINYSGASDITDNVPLNKVGAVDAFAIPSKEFHSIAMERLYSYWTVNNITFLNNRTPALYYTNRGINGGDLKYLVQAGVMVLSPKFHKAVFEYVYDSYEDTNGAEWNYEMPALSYELVKADLVFWISPRFNLLVSDTIETFYSGLINNQVHPIIKLSSRIINKLFKYQIKQKKNPIEIKIYKNIYDLSFFMHFAGCSNLMYKMKNIT